MLSSLPMSVPHSPSGPSGNPFSTPTIPTEGQPQLPVSTTFSPTQNKTSSPPKSAYRIAGPSSLTLQLQRHSNPSSTQPSREVSPMRPDQTKTIPEMMSPTLSQSNDEDTPIPHGTVPREHQKLSQYLRHLPMSPALPTDLTPLLANATLPTYMSARPPGPESVPQPAPRRTKSIRKRLHLAIGNSVEGLKTATKPSFWNSLLRRSFLALPAVFLGLLLNVLDGVSYGMILFPAGKIFDGFGPMGVSMFFMT